MGHNGIMLAHLYTLSAAHGVFEAVARFRATVFVGHRVEAYAREYGRERQ